MTLDNYLVGHVLRGIWCNPRIDRQFIWRPWRITPSVGVNNYFVYQGVHNLILPNKTDTFSVYNLGQYFTTLINMDITRSWTPLSKLVEKHNVYLNVYDYKGTQVPLSCVYIGLSNNNAILFAVKHHSRMEVDIVNQPIFIRMYSNTLFNQSTLPPDSGVKIFTKEIFSSADSIAVIDKIEAWRAKDGHVSITVNGLLRDVVRVADLETGDVAEVLYDSSIKRIVEYNVKDLLTFNSTRDDKQKYLLHENEKYDFIDYCDDVDVHLIYNNRGAFFHKNAPDTMRMITHQDYSVASQYVTNLSREQGFNNLDDLKLRLFIRDTGHKRPLVHEHHRIHDLYKLPHVRIVKAMLGLDSVIPDWKAAELENSAYVSLMENNQVDIDLPLIEKGLGYNAISYALADTPAKTFEHDGATIIETPVSSYKASTGFEYDEEGLLIGYKAHVEGTQYVCVHPDAKLVEMYSGELKTAPDEFYDQLSTPMEECVDYKCYKALKNTSGKPVGEWEDVTDSADYMIHDGEIIWQIDMSAYSTLVRSNKNILVGEVELNDSNGLLAFQLKDARQQSDGTIAATNMDVPMGQLTVWMNGRSLVKGIDYIVEFPRVVIMCKRYYDENQSNKATYRYMGLAKDGAPDENIDCGWVRHGVVSLNNRYNIRDDKVVRLVVGGQLLHRSALKFDEDGWARTRELHANGIPYACEEIFTPFKNFTTENAYSLREKSREVDKRVMDYIDLHLPMPHPDTPNVLPQHYQLYSPFLSRILSDLEKGVIVQSEIKDITTAQLAYDFCAPYRYLLDFDPTQDPIDIDLDQVNIHPTIKNTVTQVTIEAYRFLNLVVEHILHSRTKLSHFVEVI